MPMPMVVLVIWVIAGAVIVIMVVMRVVAAATIVVIEMVSVGVPIMMIVIVGILCAALGLHIGATFRIERRLKRNHPSPEARRHRLNHRIAADTQGLRQHFGQEMAVAQMPGDAGHRQGVSGPDLRQRFGLGDYLHHPSVLKPQPVAATQLRGFLEIEQEFEPADPRHGDASAIASVEVQYDRVRRSARPMAGRDDFFSAQHLYTFRLGRPRRWESMTGLTEFEREAKQTPAGL
jgi:hypothetical protein